VWETRVLCGFSKRVWTRSVRPQARRRPRPLRGAATRQGPTRELQAVIRTFPPSTNRATGRRWSRHGGRRAPPVPVQLRDPSPLTSEAYVAQQAWRHARLTQCPRHPAGGCGFARHGTYARRRPAGMRIARHYCPTAQETFSLLPDCLASRFPGARSTPSKRVVAQVESARSIEAAADALRPDIVLPSAVRWVRRRLTLVRATLLAVVTLCRICAATSPPGRRPPALETVARAWSRCAGSAPRRCCRRCPARSDSPPSPRRRGSATSSPTRPGG
jgi:hypothetical protein